jgi:hypothetical protein
MDKSICRFRVSVWVNVTENLNCWTVIGETFPRCTLRSSYGSNADTSQGQADEKTRPRSLFLKYSSFPEIGF